MRILLLRHGKPALATTPLISAEAFGTWIEAYNRAGLCEQSLPSPEAVAEVSSCRVIVCSHLIRSTESAKRLGVPSPSFIDKNFREMEMPYSALPGVRLPAKVWSVIFRILWFLGFSRNSESLTEAKARAIACAKKLESLAADNESVAFIGHGFLNKFIARQLRKNGWQGPKNPGDGYWSYALFSLSPDNAGTP